MLILLTYNLIFYLLYKYIYIYIYIIKYIYIVYDRGKNNKNNKSMQLYIINIQ